VTTSPVNRPLPRLARRTLVTLVGPAWRARHHLEIRGGERLPTRQEALILACNHAAFVDTVHLSALIRPRVVFVGAKPRLYRDPLRRGVMAVGNVLRVDDRASYLRDTTALLGRGQLLLCYPELGRNPDGLGDFSPWTAEAALTAGVDLLPLHLSGTGSAGGAIRLSVGERLPPEGDAEGLTARLRAAIEDLGR